MSTRIFFKLIQSIFYLSHQIFLIILINLFLVNSSYADKMRPITDWTSNQGTVFMTSINGYTLHRYATASDYDGTRYYIIDSFGAIARDLGLPQPTMEGTIQEKALPDGTALVTVRIHTSNALTYVADGTARQNNPQDCKLNGSPPSINVRWCPALFGYGVKDIIFAPPGSLKLSYGDQEFQIKFINTAPGAPLPDSFNLEHNPTPTQYLLFVSLTSSTFGGLRASFGVPDGTPGRASTVQTGFFSDSNPGLPNNIIDDGFPVENVLLKVVGKGSQ